MENLEIITTFLGWCTLVNFGVYLFSAVMLTLFRGPVKNIHSKISGLSQEDLEKAYFNFLANYKLAILILNFVPYAALLLMAPK